MGNFVSFEIAKKLKEKGFREDCIAKVNLDNTITFNHVFGNDIRTVLKCHNKLNPYVDAPTISQVLKWLREEKKIYVMIDRSFSVENSWHYVICNNDDFEHLIQQESIPNRTWEQAALVGIEYVLDNLI